MQAKLVEHSNPALKGKSIARALDARAKEQVLRAARVIQGHWRGVDGRHRFAKIVEAYQAQMAANTTLRAAITLQRRWRGHAAIEKMKLLTQELYKCYIDGESGMPYWENQVTKVTTWTQPFLLRGSDVNEIIHMPKEEDAFIVRSIRATSVPRRSFACSKISCSSCHAAFHSKGKPEHFMRQCQSMCA